VDTEEFVPILKNLTEDKQQSKLKTKNNIPFCTPTQIATHFQATQADTQASL